MLFRSRTAGEIDVSRVTALRITVGGQTVEVRKKKDSKGEWMIASPIPARANAPVLAVADAMAYGGAWVVTHTAESWPAVRQAPSWARRMAS